MARLSNWRRARGLSQDDLAIQLGLRSKGHVSRLENGNGITTDLAIAIDRLTRGEVSVSELRPDLADVRVIQPESGAPA